MRFLILLALLALATPAVAQQSVARTRPKNTSPATSTNKRPITTTQAPSHVGELQTICGVVGSANYLPQRRGQPTYLNLGEPTPGQTLSVVIWGESRAAFPEPPEVAYQGKRVCVTAVIGERWGNTEVVARGPGDIRVRTESATTLP